MAEDIRAQIVIRQARREDIPATVRLLANDPLGQTRERYQDPLPDAYFQAFEAVSADANQFLAVMEYEGKIIGTLQLTFIPGLSRLGSWRAQVEAVRIDDEFRGQSLGEHLMQWAIAKAKEQGCSMMQLTTDKSRREAHRFYERLGFVASHEGMKLKL